MIVLSYGLVDHRNYNSRQIATFLVMRVLLGLEYRSRLEKGFDPEGTEFTAHAGVFKSAERRLLIIKHAVDCYAACEEMGGHAASALYIGPAHVGVQAVGGIVDDPDRILVVFVGDDT